MHSEWKMFWSSNNVIIFKFVKYTIIFWGNISILIILSCPFIDHKNGISSIFHINYFNISNTAECNEKLSHNWIKMIKLVVHLPVSVKFSYCVRNPHKTVLKLKYSSIINNNIMQTWSNFQKNVQKRKKRKLFFYKHA